MAAKTVAQLSKDQISGKRVLVRVDFNVPLSADGAITDDTRIQRALPTLKHLLEAGGRLVVTSHLGRPKGERKEEFSLRPVAEHLKGLLEHPVHFAPDLVGDEVARAVDGLENGQLLLLENTRFHPGETTNDAALAGSLAKLGDLYVNDAFGAAHRAHASTVGVAEAVRRKGGQAVAGFLMERELKYLGLVMEEPERPFVAILGGAKISGKIDVIQSLLPKVDRLIIGGAMANTFFRAMGLQTGASLVEEDRVEMAGELLEAAGAAILLPVDCVVSEEISPQAETRSVPRDEVGAQDRIGDVGPATEALFSEALKEARTVVWNGPMGVFEMPPFAHGTVSVAESVAQVSDAGGVTVVGGGDSASAAEAAGVSQRLTHVSTGGGASLEFLSGAVLPGVAALDSQEGSE